MMRKSSSAPNVNRNISYILILFGCAFSVLVLKLFFLQVLDHKKYSVLAQNQYKGSQEIPARRGDILSSDGYVLAGTQDYYLMYGEPNIVKDKSGTAELLAKTVSVEETTETSGANSQALLYANKFSKYSEALKNDLLWVPLERSLPPTLREKISDLHISGIGFEVVPKRFYPEQSLASHVLGYVASDEKGENTGYYGIEGSFNEDLKGRVGRILEEVDATGAPILVGNYRKVPAIEGRSIYLTINRALQFMVEKRLKEGVENYDAISGTAIVMDPFTGDILAMANYPTYIPSDFSSTPVPLKDSPFRNTINKENLAISLNYEPGSVIKPLTVAAAINDGLITPDTEYEDSGPVNYSGKMVDNWDHKHWGTMNIVKLLQKSNNIGAAWVGTKVGNKRLYEYFKNFGLGEKTRVDLEGEEAGVLHDYKNWTDIDLANASFGQGLLTTPLQILNAFNVFANGGYLLQPKIVSKIVDNGKVIEIPTKNLRRVISKSTSEQMISLLEKAAAGGEAAWFVTKDYRIAGKTGTAQIYDNGYDNNRTNATFVGFLAGEKKLSVIVKVQEPHKHIYASETAAPIWMEISGDLVKYYGIAPDKIPDKK